jgi:hypothetical protein
MPPKSRFNIVPKPCGGKSKISLSNYISKNLDSILSPFAYALYQKGYLVDFQDYPDANECVFSYNNSLWHSVYLKNKETGETYWDRDSMKGAKLYFKLGPTEDGGAEVVAATTTTPSELIINGVEIPNCSISASGSCVVGKVKSPAIPKVPKVPKAKGKKKQDESDEDLDEEPGDVNILSKVVQLNLNTARPSGAKTTHERKFFENFANKTLLVNWMVENMEYHDVLKCIQRGALSQVDIAAAEAIGETAGPSGSGAGPSTIQESDIETIIASLEQFSVSDVNSMLKKITRDAVKQRIINISDPKLKRTEIINLCNKNSITGYKITGGKITRNGIPVNINRPLEECSAAEHSRLRNRITEVLRGLQQQRKVFTRQDPISGKVLTRQELMTGNDPISGKYLKDVHINYPTIKDLSVVEGLVFGKYPLENNKYSKAKVITSKDLRIWTKNTNPASSSAFGLSIPPDVKAQITSEMELFARDVKAKVLTKTVFMELFMQVIPSKYISMIKIHDFKSLYSNKSDILKSIKLGLSPSIMASFLASRIIPIFIDHFNKYKDQLDQLESIVCPLFIKKIGGPLKTALSIMFVELGPLEVPLLAILHSPVKNPINASLGKICKQVVTASINKIKSLSFGKKRKYTFTGGRKSPGVSAAKYLVGTSKLGLDGKLWTIKKSINGIKRWVKK